jgi:uncharacterized protein (TIGR03437 family)
LRFADGQVTVSFGSSDLSVRDLWVMSPTHAVLNLAAATNAVPGTSTVSVISGFQMASQALSFTTQQQNSQIPALALPLINGNPLQSTYYPGAILSLYGSNLAVSPSSATLTIGGQAAKLLYVSANQINFEVPNNLPVGPAILNLNNGAADAAPIVLQIDPAPATIIAVTASDNTILDANHLAVLGDTLQILVGGLDPAVLNAPGRVRINVNGIDVAAASIQMTNGQTAVLLVQFYLPVSLSGQTAAQIYLSQDGNPSNPVTINLKTT